MIIDFIHEDTLVKRGRVSNKPFIAFGFGGKYNGIAPWTAKVAEMLSKDFALMAVVLKEKNGNKKKKAKRSKT